MTSKLFVKRLLFSNYLSNNCQNLLKNRQLINKTIVLSQCLRNRSNAVEKALTLSDKFKEIASRSKRPRNDLQDIDVNDKELMDLIGDRKINALSDKPDNELLDEISPTLPISFNLAAFANKSETIQMLVKLGVDLSHIEKKSPETAEYLLKLDFEQQIKPYIRFLVDNGVEAEDLGQYITKNPLIFSQHIEDLEIRIKYLKSKKFTKQMIASVVTNAPKLLNFSTKSVDYKLGFIQKAFQLTANELRHVVTTYPIFATLHDMAYKV